MRTILVVDDEPMVLRVLSAMLRNAGYDVLEATDGEAALKAYDAAPLGIDLLLTDVVMPWMSGPDLAEALRSRQRDLKVLFTAGMPNSQVIQNRVRNPGYPLLPKPFSPVQLVRAVEGLLQERRGYAAGHDC